VTLGPLPDARVAPLIREADPAIARVPVAPCIGNRAVENSVAIIDAKGMS
jgi:hypothetical protein